MQKGIVFVSTSIGAFFYLLSLLTHPKMGPKMRKTENPVSFRHYGGVLLMLLLMGGVSARPCAPKRPSPLMTCLKTRGRFIFRSTAMWD